MSSAYSISKIKTTFLKTKRKPKLGRDFIIEPLQKSGPASHLQTQVKKLTDGGIVEFKKIPKLKYTKDSEPKFPYVFMYRVKQCNYIYHFAAEEKEQTRLLKTQELAQTEQFGSADMTYITMHRRMRKQQKDSTNYDTGELLHKARTGARASIIGKDKQKKKKKPKKERSKDPEENVRFIKAEILEQILNYLSIISEYKPLLDEEMMITLIEMLSINLFIPSTKKQFIPPLRVKAGSGRFLCDPLDVPHSGWAHRSLVYKIIFHLCLCYNEGIPPPDVETEPKEGSFQEIFRKHINESFITHLVNALSSNDQLERETIVACLVLLAEQCAYLKPIIWKIVKVSFTSYASDGMWDLSTASTKILSLLCLVEGAYPCDAKFVTRCLLPLYKAPFEVMVRYYPVLLKLVIKLLRDDHGLIRPVIERLLWCWPIQSASKQLLFLEQLSAIFLEVVLRAGAAAQRPNEDIAPQQQWLYSEEDMVTFMSLYQPLFNQICTCLEGQHYEVSVAAIRILDHPAVFFPFVLAPNVEPAETLPDGTLDARKHPVLSVIYRSFRRVVANHDYVEVRKTIHTLMGLLEEHWGDVCEKEIVLENSREKQREQRRDAFEAMCMKYEAHSKLLNKRKPSSLASSSRKSSKPREQDKEATDELDTFQHLNRTTRAVSEIFREGTTAISSPKAAKRRGSVILESERKKRNTLIPVPNDHRKFSRRAKSTADKDWFALSKKGGPRRRKGSFELMLEDMKKKKGEANKHEEKLPEREREKLQEREEEKLQEGEDKKGASKITVEPDPPPEEKVNEEGTSDEPPNGEEQSEEDDFVDDDLVEHLAKLKCSTTSSGARLRTLSLISMGES